MSRACPYTSRRQCVMVFGNRQASDINPSNDQIRKLQPVAGLLADLAREYDEAGPVTSASDFVAWLQLNVAAAA